MTKTFWIVTEGVATPATGYEDWDGVESVMAYAETAADALALARRYDAGEIAPDNIPVGYVALR